MGCDIHLRVQAQQADGSWHDVPESALGPSWGDYSSGERPRSRNYMLFARLAGVRNYENAFVPLFAERGVPPDLAGVAYHEPPDPAEVEGSPEYDPQYAQDMADQRSANPDWDDWASHPDYHSHTWATIAELRAADWAVERHEQLRTDPEVYRRWRDEGARPWEVNHWLLLGGGDRQRPLSESLSEEEFRAGEQAGSTEERAEFSRRMMNGRASVRFSVASTPLLQCEFVRWLSCETVEALVRSAGGAERVRLLIAFDN